MPHVFEALLKDWKLFFSIATVKTGAECTGWVEAWDGGSKLNID